MNLRPGYKQTEVGVIPEDWDVRLTTNLVESGSPICYGLVQVGQDTWDGVPIIAIKYVKDIQNSPLHRTSTTIENRYTRSRVQGGDVLISIKGTIGRVGVVPEGFRGNISRELARLRPNDGYSSEYIAYQLEAGHTQERISRAVVGTTRLEFSIAALQKFELAVPNTLEEQHAISSALRDVDALISGLDRLIAKKRDLKQAAMQQLLTGKKLLPGFNGKWDVKRLGDIASLHRENVIPSNSPDQLFVHYSLPAFDAGKNPVIELGSAIGSNKFKVPGDAVLVSKLNPRIPRVWAPSYIPPEAISSTEFLVLKPKEKTSRNFLYVVCSSASFCEQMEMSATGTTGSHQRINPTDALNIEFPVPLDQAEQTAIATILSDMDTEIAALEQRREKTRDLKQGMMQELLTGRIRLV